MCERERGRGAGMEVGGGERGAERQSGRETEKQRRGRGRRRGGGEIYVAERASDRKTAR